MEARQEKELANLKHILVEAERWRQAKVMRDYANEVEQSAHANKFVHRSTGRMD